MLRLCSLDLRLKAVLVRAMKLLDRPRQLYASMDEEMALTLREVFASPLRTERYLALQ